MLLLLDVHLLVRDCQETKIQWPEREGREVQITGGLISVRLAIVVRDTETTDRMCCRVYRGLWFGDIDCEMMRIVESETFVSKPSQVFHLILPKSPSSSFGCACDHPTRVPA